jgi:hypothetical protein
MENNIGVNDVGGFLNAVDSIRKEWMSQEPELKAWDELWFRGEGHAYPETKLRPALYRPAKDEIPKQPKDLIAIEDDLYQHFQHNSTELAREESVSEDADDAWGSYFLMQHYGGPTRLLDWSDGALISLHFALKDENNSGLDRFVYVLDPYWLMDYLNDETKEYEMAVRDWGAYCANHLTAGLDVDDWDQIYIPDEDGHEELPIPELPLVLEFDHFARRISAQRSRFVVMGTKSDFFSELLMREDSRLKSIVIDKDSVIPMRTQLRDAGITESVIYPNLDGLGRELKQLWAERLREPSKPSDELQKKL